MNVWFGKFRKLLEHGIYTEQYIILNAHKFWTTLCFVWLSQTYTHVFK